MNAELSLLQNMIVLFNFENMLMINAAVAMRKQDNMKIAFPWQNNTAISALGSGGDNSVLFYTFRQWQG